MDKKVFNGFKTDLRVIAREISTLQKYGAKFAELNQIQFVSLLELGRLKKVTITQLAEALNTDKSNYSRTIYEMYEKGYLEREESSEDRRQTFISLSKKGKKIYRYVEKYYKTLHEKFFAEIPAEKHEMVTESIMLLSRAIADVAHREKCKYQEK